MARPPKCKNCVNFQRREDGSCWCEKVGHFLAPESANVCKGEFFVRVKYRKVGTGELSDIRRAASLSRKTFAGGRKPITNREPMKSAVRLFESDHGFISELAWEMRQSLSQTIHFLVEYYKTH